MTYRRIPYSIPMKPEELEAYLTMPKTPEGLVISLFYLPPWLVPRMEPLWLKWIAEHPRHLWPNWATAWAEHRRKHPVEPVP